MDQNDIEISGLKKVILSILGFLVVVVAVVGISFAAYRVTQTSTANSITSGSVVMNYTESSNGIALANAVPIHDEVGMNMSDSSEYFDFSVSTTTSGEIDIPYEINLSEGFVEENILDRKYVKVYLTKIVDGQEEVIVSPTNLSDLNVSDIREDAIKLYVANDVHELSENKVNKYRLRMWIDFDADMNLISNSSYKITVNVDSVVTAK